MPWNWELPGWPNFIFDLDITQKERLFLLNVGKSLAFLKNIDKGDYNKFIIEILCEEGLESSKIEGEILERESLQSSIKKHFGLKTKEIEKSKELGMAALLCNVYETYNSPLTHEMLFNWHKELFQNQPGVEECGKYRTHKEPMQIVSHKYGSLRVFFEAPPSSRVFKEMAKFIDWFNSSQSISILGKAAVAHVYFESIHPFEDGNGRIGRLLVEKILSLGIGRPSLIAVSKVLEKRRKQYYEALGTCNQTLEIQHFVDFFTSAILDAQKESMGFLYFLIVKSKMLNSLSGKINPRQEKVLLRMFSEGPNGFKGGLNAEKYISITKTTRATATRDLADLVQKHALIKTGELKYTRYWLNIQDSCF